MPFASVRYVPRDALVRELKYADGVNVLDGDDDAGVVVTDTGRTAADVDAPEDTVGADGATAGRLIAAKYHATTPMMTIITISVHMLFFMVSL